MRRQVWVKFVIGYELDEDDDDIVKEVLQKYGAREFVNWCGEGCGIDDLDLEIIDDKFEE